MHENGLFVCYIPSLDLRRINADNTPSYGVSGEESLALSFLVFGVSFLLLVGTVGGLIEGRNLFFPSRGEEKPYEI